MLTMHCVVSDNDCTKPIHHVIFKRRHLTEFSSAVQHNNNATYERQKTGGNVNHKSNELEEMPAIANGSRVRQYSRFWVKLLANISNTYLIPFRRLSTVVRINNLTDTNKFHSRDSMH